MGRTFLKFPTKITCERYQFSTTTEGLIDIDSRAQYAVLQQLGIKRVYAVVGFSMGGQQV
jgi:homoserine acetyltransferase